MLLVSSCRTPRSFCRVVQAKSLTKKEWALAWSGGLPANEPKGWLGSPDRLHSMTSSLQTNSGPLAVLDAWDAWGRLELLGMTSDGRSEGRIRLMQACRPAGCVTGLG